MSARGSYQTRQQEAVARLFENRPDSCLTAEEAYQELEKELSREGLAIGKTTVYRAIVKAGSCASTPRRKAASRLIISSTAAGRATCTSAACAAAPWSTCTAARSTCSRSICPIITAFRWTRDGRCSTACAPPVKTRRKPIDSSDRCSFLRYCAAFFPFACPGGIVGGTCPASAGSRRLSRLRFCPGHRRGRGGGHAAATARGGRSFL